MGGEARAQTSYSGAYSSAFRTPFDRGMAALLLEFPTVYVLRSAVFCCSATSVWERMCECRQGKDEMITIRRKDAGTDGGHRPS